jgi:hypothetical protein
MNTEEIIQQIDGEISKLQQARGLLLGTDSPIKESPGRSKKKATAARIPAVKPTKRVMSPEGRARLVAAVKARWARARKTANSAVVKSTAKKVATKKSVKKAVKATSAKATKAIANGKESKTPALGATAKA